jgi:hypothetical protein
MGLAKPSMLIAGFKLLCQNGSNPSRRSIRPYIVTVKHAASGAVKRFGA